MEVIEQKVKKAVSALMSVDSSVVPSICDITGDHVYVLTTSYHADSVEAQSVFCSKRCRPDWNNEDKESSSQSRDMYWQTCQFCFHNGLVSKDEVAKDEIAEEKEGSNLVNSLSLCQNCRLAMKHIL